LHDCLSLGHRSRGLLDNVREVGVWASGGFWPRNKKKAASLIGYLKEELQLGKAKISVRKLAKSAGIVFTSYDLEETERGLFLQGLIATDETATLVK